MTGFNTGQRFSVVIAVHDELAALIRCIEALVEHTPDDDWSLVVVDDASTDGTAEFLTCLEGDITIRRLENSLGRGRALEIGIAETTAPVVVVLDPRVAVTAGWAEALLAELARRPEDVGAVQLRIVGSDGALVDAGVRRVAGDAWFRGAGHPSPLDPMFLSDPDACSLRCTAFRGDLLRPVRFDEYLPAGAHLAAQVWSSLPPTIGAAMAPGPVANWIGEHVPDESGRDRYELLHPEEVTRARPPVRSIAFHLPQFHPIRENDEWWGPGFTEWHNVAQARPRFDGHEQPHLPADLGFYDLRLTETREQQAAMARAHGVDAFCYYHYWFQGRRLLHEPVDRILASGEPDFPFLLCWANESWRSNWDGRSGRVLVEQCYDEDDDRAHIEWLLEVFADDRYVRVDGKPYFLVYRASSLPDARRTTDLWRERASAAGVGELHLARVESFPEDRSDPRPLGFDSSVEFQPDWDALGAPRNDVRTAQGDRIYAYRDIVQRMLAKPSVPWRRSPCVTPRWDNTARRRSDALILSASTPELYESWLTTVVAREQERCSATGDEGIVFVNAWNEWAEGAHLEPCQTWGRRYLEAHRVAMGGVRPRPPAIEREVMAQHAAEVDELGRQASRLASPDPDTALALVEAAADHAWYAHTGRFVLPQLEQVAAGIGSRLGRVPRTAAAHDRRTRVLHVLSEAHTGGGHTRLAWRWIGADRSRSHHVALTHQGSLEVPRALVDLADETHRVDDHTSLVERAVVLRRLAADFDVVVLHTHPYDAVAVAALSHEDRPPTVICNHAGHVSWLGVGVGDVVACLRPATAELAIERRGVDPGRVVILPSPLVPTSRRLDREDAKRCFGLEPEATVIVSIASAYKFAPSDGIGFLDLLRPVLDEHRDAVLLVVGPEPSGVWAEASIRTGGRVLALGRRDDLSAVHDAADVYVDSFPLPSTTSFLEVAMRGVPVVTFRPHDDVLGADDVALDDELSAPPEFGQFQEEMRMLIGDSGHRATVGRRGAAAVERLHTGAGWLDQLEAVYRRVQGLPRRLGPVRMPAGEMATGLDERLLALHDRGGMIRPLQQVIASHAAQPAAVAR